MPYLGKSPQHGNYSKLDDFSGDFDGSDATHAVASNGVAITPVRPEALIISINGVIQEPTTDYTVSGTNITFTTAPTAGDNFFGVAMGEQLAIGTPSDATITAAKLDTAILTGHTDIGAAIADADLLLVDDGAGGTLRKTAASRIKTYVEASAMAVTGNVTATGTVEPAGDTSAGDNAAIGYTAGEGLILTGQGSTDDITIKNDADTTVLNVATGSTDIEVSAGDLIFGTAGKGICLGVTTNTDSNTLDDYEEGTFTPTLVAASVSGSISYSAQLGRYIKTGDNVYISIRLITTGIASNSGNIHIAGLPFTAHASNSAEAYAGYAVGLNITAGHHVSGRVTNGGSIIPLYVWDVSTGTSLMQMSEWTADGDLAINVTYEAA